MVVRSHAAKGPQGFRYPLLRHSAEYALRAMTIVAKEHHRGPVSATRLAEATGVPKHYLSKVLRRLVLASLLVAQRGHGGGFSLARPARLISFGEVLEAVGFTPDSHRCAFGWGDCNHARPCPLHPAFSRLNEGVLGWLAETSLADVVPHGR